MKESLSDFLSEYSQEHITKNYDLLSNSEKEKLLNDIGSINFQLINSLYEDSLKSEKLNASQISPLKIIDCNHLENKEMIRNLGKDAIKNGEYAVIIDSTINYLSTNNGMLEFNIHGNNKSIFELYVDELKLAKRKFKKYINLYIMTSVQNEEIIHKYFKSNNYFGYPKQCIHYFSQSELPILDCNGKVIMENDYKIKKDNTGDIIDAINKNNLVDEFINKKIKYLLFVAANNVFYKISDIKFLGSLIYGNYPIGVKGIIKESKTDKEGILCKYLNKPSLIDGNYIDEDKFYKTNNNGKYIYRYISTNNYIITVNELKKYINISLPYHKKKTHDNYKFEKSIYDAFNYSMDMFVYETNEEEYYPIMSEDNIKTVEKKLNKKIVCEKEEELIVERFMKKEKILFEEYLNKDMKILDLACNKGNISLNLYRLGYKNITGHDLYKANIRLLKKYIKDTDIDIKFNQGILEKLKYDNDSFDAVIYSMNAINREVLNEVYRVLKNNAISIIIAPEKYNSFLKPDIYKIIDIVSIGDHKKAWVVEKLPIENIVYL